MWRPRRLIALWATIACYSDSFTFYVWRTDTNTTFRGCSVDGPTIPRSVSVSLALCATDTGCTIKGPLSQQENLQFWFLSSVHSNITLMQDYLAVGHKGQDALHHSFCNYCIHKRKRSPQPKFHLYLLCYFIALPVPGLYSAEWNEVLLTERD
jgi:hypothetical protein